MTVLLFRESNGIIWGLPTDQYEIFVMTNTRFVDINHNEVYRFFLPQTGGASSQAPSVRQDSDCVPDRVYPLSQVKEIIVVWPSDVYAGLLPTGVTKLEH